MDYTNIMHGYMDLEWILWWFYRFLLDDSILKVSNSNHLGHSYIWLINEQYLVSYELNYQIPFEPLFIWLPENYNDVNDVNVYLP